MLETVDTGDFRDSGHCVGLAGSPCTKAGGQGMAELCAEPVVDEEVDGAVDAGHGVLDGDDGVEQVAG